MLFRDYFFIKLHIYTWKSRVQTGVNRCKWVRMGADGCVRVQGAQEAQKQGKERQKWSCMTCLLPLWPGKFPRTSCFDKNKKNAWMTPDGCVWGLCECFGAWGHGETGKQVGGKHKWGERVVFCMRGHTNKKAAEMQWWSQQSERTDEGGNVGKIRGVQVVYTN